jgi:uncharacterized protein YbjT (DUF2867 family)
MRILVLGASGLVGAAVTARLIGDGHDVVGVGRDLAAARRRAPSVDWRRIDLATLDAPAAEALLAGVDAVVDCAGALQDGPADRLRAVHVGAVETLARACERQGVRRFVLISAAGIDCADTPFSATKRRGEAALAAFDLDCVVLRPGLVLGPAAYGGSALLRALAAFPGFIVAVRPDAKVQVVALTDVAEAVARAVPPDAPARFACDLVASEVSTLAEVLVALRAWLGFPPAPVIALPLWVGRLAAGLADALAWLGWRSPLRSTTLRQLAAGVVGDPADAPRRLGFTPQTLAELLASQPAGVQERWFARMYLAKPLMLITLAGFWIASGLIGLINLDAAATVLMRGGLPGGAAKALAGAGGVIDLALGLLALARPSARLALQGMIVVTLAYLALATVWRPDLWADPLGPLVKTAAELVLALATLAVIDAR